MIRLEVCSVRASWPGAEVTPNCFNVRDANRQQLAYVYYKSEPGRRSAPKLLSKDEAHWIAVNCQIAGVNAQARRRIAAITTNKTLSVHD